MKFIADVMLGRLARWLRFLGFDTEYFHDITDKKLLRIAREQERFILTRDTRMGEIKGVTDILLIKSNEPFKQLREVLDTFNLQQFSILSRCVKCNNQLARVSDKQEIKDSVPEFVFIHFNEFLKCIHCGRVYWEGTHPKQFKDNLRDILTR